MSTKKRNLVRRYFNVLLLPLLAYVFNPAMATSPIDFPAAPENLAFEITAFDSAKFTWDAPNDIVYGVPDLYKLYLDGDLIREGSFTAYSIGGSFSIDQEYIFAVRAVYSAFGVESDLRGVSFSTLGHTLSNLRAEAYSKTAIELFWDRERFASSNLVYEVYRDGELVFTTTGNSFYDDGLFAGTQYVYEIFISKSGNRSSANIIEVETLGGTGSIVGSSCSSVVVDFGVISWSDDGWYQVQSSVDYQAFCEGGLSCAVPAGSYNVVNLTNGQRCENIQVGFIEPPVIPPVSGGAPSGPYNTSIAVYSSTAAELFWVNGENDIELTEVYRDNELLATTNGTSFFDNTRARNQRYPYALVSIDAAGHRSDRVELERQ